MYSCTLCVQLLKNWRSAERWKPRFDICLFQLTRWSWSFARKPSFYIKTNPIILCIKVVWIINQGELLEQQILHIFKTPKVPPWRLTHVSDALLFTRLNEKYLICARWNVWSASDEDEVQERTGDTVDGCRHGGRLSPPHTYLLCYSACSVQCRSKPTKSTFYRHPKHLTLESVITKPHS